MPLPIPNLDDRRFDDLVAEAITRIEAHTPEWSNIAPGDPGSALIDMFAWLAETILYRQNLIPLRQRRAFMNLLGMPLRPAAPATGVVCVDAGPLPLPPPIPAGQAQFSAGPVTFTSTTDLQPTPLQLVPMIKARHVEADAASQAKLIAMLRTLYNYDQPVPFVAQPAFDPGGILRLSDALDNQIWLALVTPKGFGSAAADVQKALAANGGGTLAMGLAPASDIPGTQAFDQATSLPARTLNWAAVTQDGSGGVRQIPLEVRADTSNGGRAAGVTLLRLPSNPSLLAPPPQPNSGDPMYAGSGSQPPELPVDVTTDRVVMWLTLTTSDPAFTLGWLGVNAVGIIGQAVEKDEALGAATGAGDWTVTIRYTPVDPASLVLQVWPQQPGQSQAVQPQTWTRVDNFGSSGRNDMVYVLDPAAGTVTFGDGIRGMRPLAGSVIVAASYAHGGGAATNLPPGAVKAVLVKTDQTGAPSYPAVTARHEWPTAGGSDGESVADAERRIPAFLANRDRAVTADDFKALAMVTPGVTLGRATVAQGLMPGADADATRTGVPGVVSVFVWPSQPIAFGNGPVATLAQLQLVFAWLRQRILIGTQLFVLAAEPVPIYASVSIRVLNGADALAAMQGVQQALAAYLWPLPPGGTDQGGWALGRTVATDELLTQAARVSGVLAADLVVLYQQNAGVWSAVSAVTLKPWQVPALQGVGVSTDGSGPPPPPDGGVDTSGQTLVPIVPKTC